METENTFEADQARAQNVVDAILGVLAAIDADGAARVGRGGPVQVVANNRFAFEFNAWQIANSFGLEWDGPDYGPTAPSTLPPVVPPEPEPEPEEPET
ncbi:hypothetical protein [Brevundimonas olei]|uniref:hypothetical protein n=1 Tax=Brevundimonas olei TaxID=657642 RepID=UPI0031D6A0E5